MVILFQTVIREPVAEVTFPLLGRGTGQDRYRYLALVKNRTSPSSMLAVCATSRVVELVV